MRLRYLLPARYFVWVPIEQTVVQLVNSFARLNVPFLDTLARLTNCNEKWCRNTRSLHTITSNSKPPSMKRHCPCNLSMGSPKRETNKMRDSNTKPHLQTLIRLGENSRDCFPNFSTMVWSIPPLFQHEAFKSWADHIGRRVLHNAHALRRPITVSPKIPRHNLKPHCDRATM